MGDGVDLELVGVRCVSVETFKGEKSSRIPSGMKSELCYRNGEMEEERKEEDDKSLEAAYAHTRKSLIARLDNWEDQRTWDDFYKTYWKLIYSVAMKSGLRSDEAFDVVQETILSIAKQSKKNMYNPEKGSFKAWLMHMTRWRINDQFRKRKKDTAMSVCEWGEDGKKTSIVESMEDTKAGTLERIWDAEWQKNLADAALARVKTQVSPKQYQIFDCYVIREWDAERVKSQLGVSMTQVYLAKHRVGKILKKELDRLNKDEG